MKKQEKKTYTAEEQARIDKVITVVGREPKPTPAKKADALAVVETVKSVELSMAEPIAPVVEPAKSFEQQREEFETLRIYIKDKEAKLKQLESIERNISGLEDLQQENDNCADVPNLFEEKEDNFLLTLSGVKKNYSRPDHFKINNPAIIEEFIDMLVDKLRLKAENLRTEIAKS